MLIFGMQPYLNPTRSNMEDNLNTLIMEDDLIFFKMEDNLNFFFKWKTTSNFIVNQDFSLIVIVIHIIVNLFVITDKVLMNICGRCCTATGLLRTYPGSTLGLQVENRQLYTN